MSESSIGSPTPVRSLAGRYYTDPGVYAAERQGLLARTWQFAAHASELGAPGDYVTFEIAGENLFCIRTPTGTVKAFYNVCQHRGHELLRGRGNARRIVCPYHAWTYTPDGELHGGPNIGSVPGFERSTVRLAEVRVEDFHGFLFVNLDPDAEPMDVWFPRVREELGEFVPRIDALSPLEWVEVPEHCNWKVSVENYSECYHCQLNHPTFATGVVKARTYDIRPQGHCLRHTTECQNLERMSYPIDPHANAYSGKYSSWFLWPMFSFQVYPGNLLNTYHWRAVDHERCTVWRGWYTGDGRPESVARALAVQDRATTVAEDVRLIESVQRGLASRGYRPGPLVIDPAGGVKSEHSIAVLQGWMRADADGERSAVGGSAGPSTGAEDPVT